ncbi:MAG: PD-(D/E)XK nuclease family protein [Thermoleophilia bacterium]|nr:PD-(D/E)XK nuclease family protein [Thermoleophilia bacterium]
MPSGSDVEAVERELLASVPALLGGSIGTFDDLFEELAASGDGARPAATAAQRALAVRAALARAETDGDARSARTDGFAEALAGALEEVEAARLEPADLGGRLGDLYATYRAELDDLGLWDESRRRRFAAERVERELAAWDGRPVLAYGFEDLTATQWLLLEALAGRTDVLVSLPYEPGRPAFASLERTSDDLAQLAAGRIAELPPRYGEVAHPALAHLERALFAAARPGAPPPLEGAVRWLEGAGLRGTVELVADEILALLRGGTPAEAITVVCPSLERWRQALLTGFATLGVPFAIEARVPLAQTPFGHALLSLLRWEWADRTRARLYAFLRSPYSGLARPHVDFLEGRLRGRAVADERVEEETLRLRAAPIPVLETLRTSPGPVAAARAVACELLRGAHGLEAPPADERGLADLRSLDGVRRVLDELDGWQALGRPVSRDDVLGALERTTVRLTGAREPGRVAVVDLLRARTRRAEVVFVLGLEEGTLPRRGDVSPFLDDERRRELDERRAARLRRPEQASRDRYLFYAACTRASRRLVLVRQAAGDEGSPREPSPYWDETRRAFDPDEVARWTRRRPLSALTWPLERAPTERERIRAVAALAAQHREEASAVAAANGWERRLARALAAFERRTRLRHPDVLAELEARTSFGVTELEAFADCSSIWFVDRVVSPRAIDAEVDARLRGQVAHQALYRFYAGLPKRLGIERPQPERLGEALEFLAECLDGALAGVGVQMSALEARELRGTLARDLEALVRAEAELATPLVPRRFELSFGSERSAPELQRGLDLGGFTVSGKIDRIDVDPFSARGIVQDYKSGKSAHSAARIESELRLQIPLYMLVLRDLVGIDPLGGVYRPLAGRREARGLLRDDVREDGVPGFHRNDYLSPEDFWAQVETAAERARGIVARIRAGDVRRDPRTGTCPDWCDRWTMCRVRRA